MPSNLFSGAESAFSEEQKEQGNRRTRFPKSDALQHQSVQSEHTGMIVRLLFRIVSMTWHGITTEDVSPLQARTVSLAQCREYIYIRGRGDSCWPASGIESDETRVGE